MGRRPSVFIRPVSMEDGRRMQRISRKDPVRLRRAIVVLMSAQCQTAEDITALMQVGRAKPGARLADSVGCGRPTTATAG